MKEISATNIKQNLIDMIKNEWMLISAGDEQDYNMMTASWGFAGEMWNKDCIICAIRPQRHTFKFVDNCDKFAISFYGDNKKIHAVCGKMSGKDVNKTELTGLTPVFEDGTVYFSEARLVIICKKIYADIINPENFINCDYDEKNYPMKDYHKMIIGEIEKVLIK
ncbi:MAG: flavin reductase family protein [Acutalibacteraceae bacterium]|nr:flavin reductase family protein [Acutalibacteraceae bacterium]